MIGSQLFMGERIEYSLYSSDHSIKAFTKIVPFPLTATGDGGCSINLELMDRYGLMFTGFAEGFLSNEEVNVIAKSENEVIEFKLKFNGNGKSTVLFMHEVKGYQGGEASVKMEGKLCSVTIPYKWGTNMSTR